MSEKKGLWKTTIIVWTEDDPQSWDLSGLAFEAEEGAGYATSAKSTWVSEQGLAYELDYTDEAADFFRSYEDDDEDFERA